MKIQQSKFIIASSALFILLFVYTAVSKLVDPISFRIVLSKSPWIHDQASLLVWLIPVFELMVSLLLLIPALRLAGFIGSLVLMLAFTGYITAMILYAPHLPCGCGGIIRQLSWRQHLVVNSFFIVLAIVAIGLYLNISLFNKLFIAINRRSRKPVNE